MKRVRSSATVESASENECESVECFPENDGYGKAERPSKLDCKQFVAPRRLTLPVRISAVGSLV